jgi:hypothetical protein
MSEYQYYEFCKINSPLTAAARKEMYSLSTRANVSTHGASYVYHYGNFKGDPKRILLNHFDVFFYIANWGSLQLIFKFPIADINVHVLQQYCIDDPVSCEVVGSCALLNIDHHSEEGFSDWIEGEGMLAELLPLYNEIKSGNYELLRILIDIYDGKANVFKNSAIDQGSDIALTLAQKAFLKYAEIDQLLPNE